MGATKIFDWAAMQELIDREHAGFIRCRAIFGIAHATWVKAIRRGDIRIDTAGKPYADARKRFDWATIQSYHDEGHSVRQCARHFGFSMNSWQKARMRGAIVSRPVRLPLEQALLQLRSRIGVKRRLLEAGILQNVCSECGVSEWRGRPLSIQLDHRNGVRDDHRLENLRMLCPNCHSQTDTFGVRNRSWKK